MPIKRTTQGVTPTYRYQYRYQYQCAQWLSEVLLVKHGLHCQPCAADNEYLYLIFSTLKMSNFFQNIS